MLLNKTWFLWFYFWMSLKLIHEVMCGKNKILIFWGIAIGPIFQTVDEVDVSKYYHLGTIILEYSIINRIHVHYHNPHNICYSYNYDLQYDNGRNIIINCNQVFCINTYAFFVLFKHLSFYLEIFQSNDLRNYFFFLFFPLPLLYSSHLQGHQDLKMASLNTQNASSRSLSLV